MHCDPLKRWELLTQQLSVVSHTSISSKTTVTTSDLFGKILEMRLLLPKERQGLIFNILAASESDKISYNDKGHYFHLFQA